MANTNPGPPSTRDQIAQTLIILGPCIVIIFGVLVIWKSDNHGEAARNVMNSVLPLIGTWVGTVLAFYFARENFEAASRNTKQLLGLEEKLRSTPVSSVMIPAEKIDRWILKPGDKPEETRLQPLAEEMKRTHRNRLPIVNERGSIVYVVHLSTLTEFLAGQILQPAPDLAGISCLTLGDMKKQAEPLYQKIMAWVVIRAEASLAEAKIAMETRPHCGDVFITQSGNAADPILGWVTNVEISLKARA